jgi:signal transduction histidine kinase
MKTRPANEHPTVRSPLYWPALAFAAWTLLGLMTSLLTLISFQFAGPPRPPADAFVIGMTDMYMWGLLSAAAIFVSRKISLERFGWTSVVVLNLVAAVALLLARFLVERQILGWAGMPGPPLAQGITRSFAPRLLTYLGLLVASYGWVYIVKHRERELREVQLREELVRAQLGRLKAQLEPHFLFNSLHSISTLLHRDPLAADRMLNRLADHLRISIRAPDTQLVELEQEVAELQPYLEIEKIRFGQRLGLTIDVRCSSRLLVPHMILQPLVENAIRHGISPSVQGGHVQIRAEQLDDRVVITVEDDGVGIAGKRDTSGHGVGLANLRARLEHLYGPDQSLDVSPRDGAGTAVRVMLPAQTGK